MSNLFLERSIPELLEAIQSRELSIPDLARETVDSVAGRERETLAWVRFEGQHLLEQAANAQARLDGGAPVRGLEGLPFGVKDIFNTSAFPTEMGSALWRHFAPGNNARVVDTLLHAGALAAGKTVTAEFAVHALNETLNPHDPSRTPGTSSSGSAAAVATGMVPFALATQTAGSITRPASFCGVWGMKPSFGLVPRTGVLKTTDSLDTIGFLAAHANSLRPILDHVRVKGPDYPFVYRRMDSQGPRPKTDGTPWKVGVVHTHVWAGAESYARQAIDGLANRIAGERNFEVVEVPWPTALIGTHEIHEIIYRKSLSYYFQHEAQSSGKMSPIMAEMIAEGQRIDGAQFREALGRQEEVSQELDDLLAPYDLVLSLGTSSSAPLRGEAELADPSLIWTLAHVPAVAAPVFRDPSGLPFGAQFVARRFTDYRLLQAIESLVDIGVLPAGSAPCFAEQSQPD